MHDSMARALVVARAVVRGARANRLTFTAGSLAYHAFVSLLPLVYLLLTISEEVPVVAVEAWVVSLMEAVLTEETSTRFVEQMGQTGARTGLSILGFAVLLWGSLRIVRGLDAAFSDIYGGDPTGTLVDTFLDGIIVLGSMAAAVAGAALIQQVVPLYGAGIHLGAIHSVVLLGGLAAAMVPIYYVLPDADVDFFEVLPGVLLAALGVTAFTTVFRVYIEYTGQASSSILVNVVLLLTWLYFSSLILVVGILVNAVLSNRSRDVNVEPVFGGLQRGTDRDVATRGALLESLHELDESLADAEEMSVTIEDDDAVTLHPPHSVTIDQNAGSGPNEIVALELRWRPDEESEGD